MNEVAEFVHKMQVDPDLEPRPWMSKPFSAWPKRLRYAIEAIANGHESYERLRDEGGCTGNKWDGFRCSVRVDQAIRAVVQKIEGVPVDAVRRLPKFSPDDSCGRVQLYGEHLGYNHLRYVIVVCPESENPFPGASFGYEVMNASRGKWWEEMSSLAGARLITPHLFRDPIGYVLRPVVEFDDGTWVQAKLFYAVSRMHPGASFYIRGENLSSRIICIKDDQCVGLIAPLMSCDGSERVAYDNTRNKRLQAIADSLRKEAAVAA